MSIYSKIQNICNTINYDNNTDNTEYHNKLVNMYYERDIQMNLIPIERINHSINKLGYKSIDLLYEITNYINNKYNLENPQELSFDDFCEKICESDEFYNMVKKYYYINNRFNILSSFIETQNNKDFYNACNISELEYIGY